VPLEREAYSEPFELEDICMLVWFLLGLVGFCLLLSMVEKPPGTTEYRQGRP
jgi:hypothetical protein